MIDYAIIAVEVRKMIKRMTSNARKPGGFWGSLMIKKMNAGHFQMTKWALLKLDLPENGAVADLGCGGGRCIRLMSQMCSSKIYGIDYSPLCVKKSSRKNRKAIKNGRVEISEASVEALPFENNSIDCAVAVETIYFWNDPDKAFSEIKRVLKPNGSLNIVCEMVKNDDGSGAHTEVAELLKLNYYSKTEIENIFCRNGFVDITSHFDKENTWLMVSGKKNYES